MIHIVDAIMGAGKTSSAINYIKENAGEKKFVYITPYLDEVKRIKDACGFYEPVTSPKILDFKIALGKGLNIVTTHSLFSWFDDEVVDLCVAGEYELIMDEVHDVVDTVSVCKKDMDVLLEKYVTVDEDGAVHWSEDNKSYNGVFAEFKNMCDNRSLGYYGGNVFLTLFPAKIFQAFHEAYILTYMFDSQIQRCYFDYFNLRYDYMYVDSTYHFTDDQKYAAKKPDLLNLVKIINGKIDSVGNSDYALSVQWYKRNNTDGLLKVLRNNLYNIFRNYDVCYKDGGYKKCSANDVIWTTFGDYKNALSGKGYTKGFVPCNAKATNAYKDRTVVAYPINRYINPVIKNFFETNGIEVDEEGFATSEMVQFIWRSGIRDGKPVTLYIPSIRMKLLMIKWLSDVCGVSYQHVAKLTKLEC